MRLMHMRGGANHVLSVNFRPHVSTGVGGVGRVISSNILNGVCCVRANNNHHRNVPAPFNAAFVRSRATNLNTLNSVNYCSLSVILGTVNCPGPLAISNCGSTFFNAGPRCCVNTQPDCCDDAGRPRCTRGFNISSFTTTFVHLRNSVVLSFHVT